MLILFSCFWYQNTIGSNSCNQMNLKFLFPMGSRDYLFGVDYGMHTLYFYELNLDILAGPSGKIMLLPEDDPNATHIMIATGTGVAPYRGYLRRMFMEDVPSFRFGGLAWLFLGVANTDSLLYDNEFTKYLKDYPDQFRYDKALSREQKNRNGGKMYVQDKIEEYSDEIFKLLDGGAHIYFCGLKGMMPGIQETLKRVADQRGENWEEKLAQLKKNKQWHVEVY